MSEAPEADGPLAFDAAVGLLSVEPVQEVEETPAEQAPEPEDPIEAGDQPAEDGDGAETPAEAEQQEPEPETAVEPPHYWSQERKDAFAQLPPELQVALKDEWLSGEKVTQQKFQEAAEARKEAEARAKAFTDLTGRVSQIAAQAEEAFASRWEGMTPDAWLKLSVKDPAQYTQLKARHDAEQAVLQQTRSAREATEKVEYDNWLKDQSEKLGTMAPHLADPVKGQDEMRKAATWLQSQGVEEQAFARMGALEWSIADKARRFDEAQASLAARPKPSQPAPKPGVKPTSSAPVKPNNALETANRRLAQTGDVDDAVALLRLRRNTG
jgi:hypothetical protein